MTTQSNMTTVQIAAASLLEATDNLETSKAVLTLAFVEILNMPVEFKHGDKTYNKTPLDYLSPPTKTADDGKVVQDNALHLAHYNAMTTTTLGINDEAKANVTAFKSAVKACIRAAAGASKLGVSINNGTLRIPAYTAFTFFDDTGTKTTAGTAAFDEASRLAKIRSEVKAEMTGEPVVVPTLEGIWDEAFKMKIDCTGERQKEGGALVSIFGNLPTNTQALTYLSQAGIDLGVAPAPVPRKRVSQTTNATDAPMEQQATAAIALLHAAFTTITTTDESPFALEPLATPLRELADMITAALTLS